MKVYIDNLTKMIYNKKRMLCRIVLFTAVIGSLLLLPLGGSAADVSDTVCDEYTPFTVRLQPIAEDGAFVLTVSNPVWLCALMLQVDCLPEVKLESVELLSHLDEIELNWVDLGSCVRILLDSADNFYLSGAVLLLRFSSSEEQEAPVLVECVACSWNGDAIQPLAPVLDVNKSENRDEIALEMLSVRQEGGEIRLGVTLCVPIECFAAGAEIYVVKLSTQKTSRFTVAGVCRSGRFSAEQIVLPEGNYCVIVEALGYRKSGVSKTAEVGYCIINGALYR